MVRKEVFKRNNKGAAMVLTVIIIAVIMVFCFSLILISYNLYASQNKNLASLRNSETTNTLSVALGEELTDNDNIQKSYLWKYVRSNVAYVTTDEDWSDWPYYDENDSTGKHDEKAAIREFILSKNPEMEGTPAEVKVCMYWTLPMDADKFCEKLKNGGNRNGIRLHVKVVSTTASQVFEREECYKLTVRKNDNQGKAVLAGLSTDLSVNPAGHTLDQEEKWIWKKTN